MAETVTAAQRLEVLAGFAATLPDPSLVLDRRSVVLFRNGRCRGGVPGRVRGQRVDAGRCATRRFSMRSKRPAAPMQPQAVELHQTVPNATWYLAHISPLPNSDGMVAVMMRNLSEQRRIEALRTDFIANASHELRTPLTSLIGFVDTLLGPAAGDAAARERFLGIMRQQARTHEQAHRRPAVAQPHRDAPAPAADRHGGDEGADRRGPRWARDAIARGGCRRSPSTRRRR